MRAIFLVIFLLMTFAVEAQDDYISWTSVQLQTQLSDKTRISLKPIFRHYRDLSQYQNMSVDLSVRRDLGKGWSTLFLTRSWFIPEADYRHFLWTDVAYGLKKNTITISNRLRYHWALNVNDNKDPDYFRWSARITFRNDKKFKPYFQVEPWLRADGIYQFQRMRYEPGFSWAFGKQYRLDFQYRIEKFFNVPTERQFNVFVLNFLFII